MLKQLTISNFRLFDDPVTINFKPITVLIGRNNAGKSSIVKFLLMLQQSLGLDKSGFLVTQGEKVDLGNFHDLRNKKSQSSDLKFSLSIEGDGSPKGALSTFLSNKKKDPFGENLIYTVDSIVSYQKNNSFQGKEHGISLTLGEEQQLNRATGIYPDSLFLDFSDAQREEFGEQKTADDISRLNAENSCIETLSHYINGISHISPVKKDLPRSFGVNGNMPIKYVGATGEHTLPHLFQQHFSDNSLQYKFIHPHIQRIMKIKNISFNSLGNLSECNALNMETKQSVNIANFGFGISQCMPILVQGVMMNPYTSLMIEQPEAQIHPTAQLELGSFFADLWNNRKVGSVIETHSGNILLRLQNCIAKNELKAKDVSVAYFNMNDGRPSVWNLDIDEEGYIDSRLPLEFFGADIVEWLNMDNQK